MYITVENRESMSDKIPAEFFFRNAAAPRTSLKVDLFSKVFLKSQYMYYIHYYHPPSVIHSDMVYGPEYMTGLYQREAQTLWIVTSSSLFIRMLYLNAY